MEAIVDAGRRAAWIAMMAVTWAGVARAETLDLTLPKDPGDASAAVATRPPDVAPWGFYRDRQGRLMQVSFDLGRRVWLGVGYAPRRPLNGAMELTPVAFEFGTSYEALSRD